MGYDVVVGDVLDWAASYAGEPFHAMLTDAPYELNFMGKRWDSTGVAFQPATWAALAAHLLPGAFLMAFGGSRTYHRLACAVEDAGLIVHPAIVWLNGSGFPKATRIDTAIDKAAGNVRADRIDGGHIGIQKNGDDPPNGKAIDYPVPHVIGKGAQAQGTPIDPLAATWAGHRYGLQALKPAAEFILVAQKPYAGKPVSSIVETGAGALNIEQGRISANGAHGTRGRKKFDGFNEGDSEFLGGAIHTHKSPENPAGRWPANVLLSHLPGCRRVGTRRVRASKDTVTHTTLGIMNDDAWEAKPTLVRGYADADGRETVEAWECQPGCPVAELGEQSGELGLSKGGYRGKGTHGHDGWGMMDDPTKTPTGFNDQGTAARFFYQADWSLDVAERLAGVAPFWYAAKASRRERDAGLEGWPEQQVRRHSGGEFAHNSGSINSSKNGAHTRNPHPTVKPLALTRYLATLLLPPAAYAPRRILIPFAGSGSEMIGALLAGWEDVLGVEREAEYVEIAQARLAYWASQAIQAEMAL